MSKHHSINITPNTKISGHKRSQNNNNNAKLASRNKPCPCYHRDRGNSKTGSQEKPQVNTENKIHTKTQHVNTEKRKKNTKQMRESKRPLPSSRCLFMFNSCRLKKERSLPTC